MRKRTNKNVILLDIDLENNIFSHPTITLILQMAFIQSIFFFLGEPDSHYFIKL